MPVKGELNDARFPEDALHFKSLYFSLFNRLSEIFTLNKLLDIEFYFPVP